MTEELEAIERSALLTLHAAAPDKVRRKLGLACEVIGTALASIAARAPASAIVVNRAIGLGIDSPARREDVDALADRYRSAGVERCFVHIHPRSEPAEIRRWLQDRGLEKARGWMKFTRGREAPPVVETSLEVRRARPEDMPAFGRILAAAFDLGDDAADWLACINRTPGYYVYVSLDAGEVTGTGALYVQDGIGWLDMGATAPRYAAYCGATGEWASCLRLLEQLEPLHLAGRALGQLRQETEHLGRPVPAQLALAERAEL
jgi:hypothetical protein